MEETENIYKDKKIGKLIIENKINPESGEIELNPNQIILKKVIHFEEIKDQK